MLKIIRKLIRDPRYSNKKYFVAYVRNYITHDYDFEYCDKERLKEIVEECGFSNIHIFNSKDEYTFENEFILEGEGGNNA